MRKMENSNAARKHNRKSKTTNEQRINTGDKWMDEWMNVPPMLLPQCTAHSSQPHYLPFFLPNLSEWVSERWLSLSLTHYQIICQLSQHSQQTRQEIRHSLLTAHCSLTAHWTPATPLPNVLPFFLPNYVIHQKIHHKITQRYKNSAIVSAELHNPSEIPSQNHSTLLTKLPLFLTNYIIHQKLHHKITQRYKNSAIVSAELHNPSEIPSQNHSKLLTNLPLFLPNYINPSEIPSQNHSKVQKFCHCLCRIT